jgi:hypothetical protein
VNTSGNLTRFESQITASNGVSDKIKLNPNGDSYIEGNLHIDNLECSSISGNGSLFIPDDGSILGNVTLGTQKASNTITIGSATNFSTINMKALSINIEGIVTINGIPYYPTNNYFNPTSGFFQQI